MILLVVSPWVCAPFVSLHISKNALNFTQIGIANIFLAVSLYK